MNRREVLKTLTTTTPLNHRSLISPGEFRRVLREEPVLGLGHLQWYLRQMLSLYDRPEELTIERQANTAVLTVITPNGPWALHMNLSMLRVFPGDIRACLWASVQEAIVGEPNNLSAPLWLPPGPPDKIAEQAMQAEHEYRIDPLRPAATPFLRAVAARRPQAHKFLLQQPGPFRMFARYVYQAVVAVFPDLPLQEATTRHDFDVLIGGEHPALVLGDGCEFEPIRMDFPSRG